MRNHNEHNLPIPDALIDQIADLVAEKVIARILPYLEKPVPPPTPLVKHEPEKPPPTFLRLREVAARVGVARITIYRWMNEGRFPQSVRLGENAVAWRRDEVEAWEADPKSFVENKKGK